MIAEDVGKWLEEEGHGVVGDTLFLGFQPNLPHNCITVYDEAVPLTEDSHALSVDEYGVQLLARNLSYTTARDVLVAIHKKLSGFGGSKLISTGSEISAVFIEMPPESIGTDPQNRSEWTAHYRFRVTSSNNTYRL